MKSLLLITMTIFAMSFVVTPSSVLAHQPYCEVEDLTFPNPMSIDDPTVSLALYATIESPDDVDYFSFTAQAEDEVLLGIVIPEIDGQELFAPQFALLGSDLNSDLASLPNQVETGSYESMFTMPALEGETTSFFEPFSFTRYWERQETVVEIPTEGDYMLAVWSPDNTVGRYTLIVGSKERLGGDFNCYNENDYWTPVENDSHQDLSLPKFHF